MNQKSDSAGIAKSRQCPAFCPSYARLTVIANRSDDDEIVRLNLSISSMEYRVASLRATTPAAIAVKLRIAADMLRPDDTDSDELNLLSALADVERMATEAEQ